ncbi:alpha/beta hydrolase [uncultured Phenylobacterium sp.]|uniref:alpha/beta fold hydrolase n=1 Tax=uncultured Phenylobacterium sp. TaxID=349273 RepID=UPI0025FB59FF|nr:alpha/beta hydrolase [uncultured Phenylobacterium sp.]
MTQAIREKFAKSARHRSFYLASGPEDGVPMIFTHGWPELSISWRHQLPVFGGLGFHAVAPDMRGYGRSSVYGRQEDYGLEHAVADVIELLDHLGAEKAIWVGHDWGAPVAWSLAQQHPERTHGVAALCVPYVPEGYAPETLIALADRNLYPEDTLPAAQWDYMLAYEENFEAAAAGLDANPRAFVKLAFRRGSPEGKGKPSGSAFVRANGGFGGAALPDAPRDEEVITQADEDTYAESLARNGFFGPDSWYMNGKANMAFAARAKPRLAMPALFLHAAWDYTCYTVDDAPLARPMKANCADLSEAVVESGHWMAQEKPLEVNAHLARWLAAKLPHLWPA